MEIKQKSVLLHFHIFKNAGTTIDNILKRNFSDKAIFLDIGGHRERLSIDFVLDYIKKNCPDVKSFSSHQMRFPIHENPDFKFLPIVFIRHPIDRAFSIYSFNKRREDVEDDIAVKMAKNLSLADYIKWNIEQKKHMVIKNHQVLFLTGKPRGSQVDVADLKYTIEQLKKCFIIGVVDRMDENLTLAEEILRPYFKNIDLSYVIQNVSKEREKVLNERLKRGKLEIGKKLFEDLERANSLDLQLYSYSNRLLDERIKNINNFEKKLSDFKNKCEKCF